MEWGRARVRVPVVGLIYLSLSAKACFWYGLMVKEGGLLAERWKSEEVRFQIEFL
jgi:hypothetical protein